MENCRPTSATVGILDFGINGLAVSFENIQMGKTHPTGEKVSKPLAVDQGNPFFLTASWTFLAVISIAKAVVSLIHRGEFEEVDVLYPAIYDSASDSGISLPFFPITTPNSTSWCITTPFGSSNGPSPGEM
jgi:hypothetical protein